MDIVEIKKRKQNLQQEITKLLNDFEIETSCAILDVSLGKVWECGKGTIIDNTRLDIRVY